MAQTAGAVIVLVLLVAACSAYDYCALCQNHTMCLYPGVGSSCTVRHRVGLDATAKTEMLRVHNELRQRVAEGKELRGAPGPQPTAANMRALVWDNELEMVAQRWVDQCTDKHDACRKVASSSVGQNIWTSTFTGAGSPPNWVGVVTMWYDEVAAYSNKDVGVVRFDGTTGHYTQLVWAETSRLGCGFLEFNNGVDATSKKRRVVCNYGVAGNMLGGSVYKVGAPASQCPPGTAGGKNGFPSLCS